MFTKSGHAGRRPLGMIASTGQPRHYKNVLDRGFNKAAEATGLNREDVPKLTPHDLRHTAISRWIAAGIDAVTIARWASDTVAVILDVYAGEFDKAKRRADIQAKLAAGTAIRLT
jgi:integrase